MSVAFSGEKPSMMSHIHVGLQLVVTGRVSHPGLLIEWARPDPAG